MHSYNKSYSYFYVDTQQKLTTLCKSLSQAKVITIDTEFVRTQTLTPLLGLIQVFDKQQLALIDPIALADLSEFAQLLSNSNIIKVAHSCSEDLEALWHHLGVLPTPVFDTQFAAGLLDLGVSIGYANLVEQLFSITVDKGESRTDWTRRPLSKAQCEYACADVTHLMAIYEDISERIESLNKTQWIYDEVALMAIKKSRPVAPEWAYLTFKNNWKLNAKQRFALQQLGKWRLEEARKLNKSVNFVVKEEALLDLAINLPDTTSALFDCKLLYAKQARAYGDIIIEICRNAKTTSEDEHPKKIQRLLEFSGYKKCLAEIKTLVETVAEENDIPVTMLASKKQINQLLKWFWFDFDELSIQQLKPDMLMFWRGALLAKHFSEDNPIGQLIASHHEIMRRI